MSSLPKAIAAVLVSITLFFPVPARAAEPELQDIKPFDVQLTNAAGEEKLLFSPRDTLYFDIRFALALSEVNRYPITITLIQQAGSETEEQELYKGQLTEGFYLLRVPLERFPTESGEVNAKVIIKVRIFNRAPGGRQSFYSYRRWEGTYRVGYR